MEDIYCSICGELKSEGFMHKLDCNHEFHYKCLLQTFTKLNNLSCPYCRKGNNRLPLVNGLKKIYPGIHDLTNSEEYINVKCKHVLTKGKNKGNHCSNYCLLGNEYCKIHIKDKLVNNNDKNED
tara:strand:- start:73 stop:444 length:372 start_codon:yes stop_codon:yes gene_type:complete